MSNIEWTGRTWNPTTGCTKVSQGCKRCYAEKMHKRLQGMGKKGYEKPFLAGAVEQPDRLDMPKKRKKPTTYFVNSMSDLFHESVSLDFIDRVIGTICECPQHTFQVLTKRPEKMLEWCNRYWGTTKYHIPNLWMGISAENQEAYDERMPAFSEVNAIVKFLSLEPLIGPIDLTTQRIDRIDWAIVGGESGKGARCMDMGWVRVIAGQCEENHVDYFFKQFGSVMAKTLGLKKKGGDFTELTDHDDKIYRREMPRYFEI